jgi:hypothetical protein
MRHEYNASQALEAIMVALRKVNPALAERAQIAIDAGIDAIVEQDIEVGKGRNHKRSKREYRENRPMTDSEAIDTVIEVLEAHLIVQRKVVNSVVKEFAGAPLGRLEQAPLDAQDSNYLSLSARYTGTSKPKVKYSVEVVPNTVGVEKNLQIIVPESAREHDDPEEVKPFTVTPNDDFLEIQQLIELIRELTRFED